ncbi:hypothetical protein HOD29_04680 [archaeon]|jgi:hypothetical protein|nr:hypothetical protein [archaeon]
MAIEEITKTPEILKNLETKILPYSKKLDEINLEMVKEYKVKSFYSSISASQYPLTN